MDYPLSPQTYALVEQLRDQASPSLRRWMEQTPGWVGHVQQQNGTPVKLVPAATKAINAYVTERHYLHRGRTMAQYGYWVVPRTAPDLDTDAEVTRSALPGLWRVDDVPILGAIHFAYPRVSQRLYGYPPMQTLELARLYIEPLPNGQNPRHMASTVVGTAIKRIRADWEDRYPRMPAVQAIVSYSDTEHHEGTIYKAANFIEMGKTRGGSGKTRASAPKHADLTHVKMGWMYPFVPADPRKKLWYIILWEHPMPRRVAEIWRNEIADSNLTLPRPVLFVSPDGVEMHIDVTLLQPDTFSRDIEDLGISVYESMLTMVGRGDLDDVDIEGIQASVELVEVIPANWRRSRKTGRWDVVEKDEEARSIYD